MSAAAISNESGKRRKRDEPEVDDASKRLKEEEDANRLRLKREEEETNRGRLVLRAVRGAYTENAAKNTSAIYRVWAGALTQSTFAACTGTMNSPHDARRNAIEMIEGVISRETNVAVARFLKDALGSARRLLTGGSVFGGDATPSAIEVKVDMLNWSWSMDDHQDDTPQTEMIFVCKHTGMRLGATGGGSFAVDGEIVSDQRVCLMNFFRGKLAILAKSKFFDAKNSHTIRVGQIEHDVQTIKARLAGSVEARYDEAIDAFNAGLTALRMQRADLKLPDDVLEKKHEYDLAEARVAAHDAKYANILDDDEDDAELKAEVARMRAVCNKKRDALVYVRSCAIIAHENALDAASSITDVMETLDKTIAGEEAKYGSLVKKDDMPTAEFGAIVDGIVEKLATEVVDGQYYNCFSKLLYLFDDAKTMPTLMTQLKGIIGHEMIRTEACMAFVIGVNNHFRAVSSQTSNDF